jgi:hypothetical protein
MTAPDEMAQIIFDLQRRIKILESSAQMANTTVGGAEAVPVGDVVAEAAVTNVSMPIVQEDAVDGNDGVSDLSSMFSEFNDDLDARFEDAAADLADAATVLEIANQDITDAFGLQITGLSDRIDQIVVGAGGTLLLYSDEAPTPDDKAPVGSTWWMINAEENIVGQWQQTGTDDVPVWTPRAIESEVIANLDVGKLTAGQAAIAEVVAMRIAASTANIQTVNVANLFVTQDATMQQATINYLFANVVQAKKITADMLDVNSLNGVTITGAIIKSAATGQRAEIVSNQINFYSPTNALAGFVRGVNYSFGSGTYPVVGVGGSTYGITAGGGFPQWSGTTVGLSVNGDTAVKRVFLDPSLASDGYLCGIYGFQRASSTDSTPVPMPLLYAKNASGSAYPDMFIENVKSVSAGDFIGPDGASIVSLTGTATYSGTLAANSSDTLTVAFPTGRFTKAPLVNANGSNSRVTIGINSVTKDAVTFALGNWTSGATAGFTVYYTAEPRP